MSLDRTQARCSFCGRRPPEVRSMVAGPGAAYICNDCLQLCAEILYEETPFSEKALELASRPPVVIAAPSGLTRQDISAMPREPLRKATLELEQKQQGMTLMLHQIQFYEQHFEIHYLWIRPPFGPGFAFVPRIIFSVKDDMDTQWAGDRGGLLLERPELASDPNLAVYQGSAHFRPLPPANARALMVRAADPLGQFENPPLHAWQFEIRL